MNSSHKLELFFIVTIVFVAVSGLTEAKGKRGYKLSIPKGLPAEQIQIPAENPVTAVKIKLGHLLYFDKRLSADDTIACVSCHSPKHGFTDNQPVPTGIKGQKGGRSAPTVINRAFSGAQFWDGRAVSLEEQAKGPLINSLEMGMPNHDAVVQKLKRIKGYQKLFEKAFGPGEIDIDKVAKAIATFERTVLSGNSKYDRYIAGDKNAMNPSEIHGMELFNGKARCATCHSGFNFTDEKYHNIGVGMEASNPDFGRYNLTKKEGDRGAFKTPTLRDITATAPYMHDGSEKTLEAVVEYYNKGGFANSNLDTLMEPLNLNEQEKKDIVVFMRTLDGEGWRYIQTPEKFPQ